MLRKRYASDYLAYLRSLQADGRTAGYIFVVHKSRGILTVSKNRRHITTFGLTISGLEDARHWLTSMIELGR